MFQKFYLFIYFFDYTMQHVGPEIPNLGSNPQLPAEKVQS